MVLIIFSFYRTPPSTVAPRHLLNKAVKKGKYEVGKCQTEVLGLLYLSVNNSKAFFSTAQLLTD